MPLDPLPVNYGPVTPRLGEGIRDVLKSLDPEMAHLANSVGTSMKRRTNLDTVMKGAFMGQTPQEMAEYADAEEASREALRMAQESLSLSDREFDSAITHLKQEVQGGPTLPVRQEPQNVSPWQAALTLLGISAAPHAAFEVGAAPFLANQQTADRQYEDSLRQYQVDTRQHESAIDVARLEANLAQDRRQEALTEVRRLAQDMREAALAKQKEGKGVEAALFNLRSDAYAADDIYKLAGAARGIEDIIARYPEYARYALRSDELMGLRENLEHEAKGRADAIASKEQAAHLERLADNFRANAAARFQNRGGGLTKEAYAEIKADFDSLVAQGVDPSSIRIPSFEEWTSATPAQSNSDRQFNLSGQIFERQQRWHEEAKAEAALKTANQPKAKQIAELDKLLNETRRKWLIARQKELLQMKGSILGAKFDLSSGSTFELETRYRVYRAEKDKLTGYKRTGANSLEGELPDGSRVQARKGGNAPVNPLSGPLTMPKGWKMDGG